MKKITITIGALVIGAITSFAALGGAGYTGSPAPIVTTATLTPYTPSILVTGNVQVVEVQLVTTSGTGTAQFYDSSSTAAPYYGTNFVTGSYVSRSGYTTNMVTSFVGYNGVTNWYTNTGYFTYSVTNAAATNKLTPKGVVALIGGTVTSSDNPMRFVNGVSVNATTNATAIISYLPAQ